VRAPPLNHTRAVSVGKKALLSRRFYHGAAILQAESFTVIGQDGTKVCLRKLGCTRKTGVHDESCWRCGVWIDISRMFRIDPRFPQIIASNDGIKV
jgi:hypothetical protein